VKPTSAFERETRLREIVGVDADEAAARTSGDTRRTGEYEATDKHFGSGYWWESIPEGCYNEAGAKAAYPDCPPHQYRFSLGWYRAGSGEWRSSVLTEEALAGWDAFAARYPGRVRHDPWDTNKER
jgi:hypothetical protein